MCAPTPSAAVPSEPRLDVIAESCRAPRVELRWDDPTVALESASVGLAMVSFIEPIPPTETEALLVPVPAICRSTRIAGLRPLGSLITNRCVSPRSAPDTNVSSGRKALYWLKATGWPFDPGDTNCCSIVWPVTKPPSGFTPSELANRVTVPGGAPGSPPILADG